MFPTSISESPYMDDDTSKGKLGKLGVKFQLEVEV